MLNNEVKQILIKMYCKNKCYWRICLVFFYFAFANSAQAYTSQEAKQTAEQNALKAERDLDRIKVEAQQTIAAATAEAEALRLQKMNISPDLIELRKIEANLKAIEKWPDQPFTMRKMNFYARTL